MKIVALTHFPTGYDLPVAGEPFNWPDAPSDIELRRIGYARIDIQPASFDRRIRKIASSVDSWSRAVISRVAVIEDRLLADVKAEAYAAVAGAFEFRSRDILLGYSPAERATWPMQIAEAKAVAVDPTAPASLLLGITLAGETVPEVAAKILTTAGSLLTAAAPLIKYRRLLSAQIAAAQTVGEIVAILDNMAWSKQ